MLANAAAMASAVHAVIEAGWRVVIVHGNGPQVGSLALQQEATTMVPAQPLPLLGAMTQGLLGSLLARAIDLLRGPGTAVALITHVTVDPADPAFGSPSKPIGPFFEPAEARRLAEARGWVVQPDSGRGLPPGRRLARAGRRDRDRRAAGPDRRGSSRHRGRRRRDPGKLHRAARRPAPMRSSTRTGPPG